MKKNAIIAAIVFAAVLFAAVLLFINNETPAKNDKPANRIVLKIGETVVTLRLECRYQPIGIDDYHDDLRHVSSRPTPKETKTVIRYDFDYLLPEKPSIPSPTVSEKTRQRKNNQKREKTLQRWTRKPLHNPRRAPRTGDFFILYNHKQI